MPMRVHVCVSILIQEWRPEVDIRCLPQSLLHPFKRKTKPNQDLSLNLDLAALIRLVGT